MTSYVEATHTEDLLNRHPNVPVSDARASMAQVTRRVDERGERVLLTRHGQPIAAVVSMPDLIRLHAADEQAREALAWPGSGIGEIEGDPLVATDGTESADDAALRAEVETLVRQAAKAILHNVELQQIMHDFLNKASTAQERRTEPV